MGYIPEEHKKVNEYIFRWGKRFTFLTVRTLNSKLEVINGLVKIDMERYYLGFIKGTRKSFQIPANNIQNIEIKTSVYLLDLLMPVLYVLAGIFLNPLFLIIVPLSVWACFNTYIIIYTEENKKIKFPSFSKKEAAEFVYYINDVYLDKN